MAATNPLYPSLGDDPFQGYQPAPQFMERPDTDDKIKAFLRSGYDFVVLIDKSSSMRYLVDEDDTDSSRWAEVRESLNLIVEEAVEFDPDGVDVCFFGTQTVWHEHVESSTKVKALFQKIKPRGSTNLSDALLETFDRHMDSAKPNQKTIVLVITDGAPDDPKGVEEKIVRFATEKLHQDQMFPFRQPDGKTTLKTLEFGIRFFQVGDDEGATEWLEHADEHLRCRINHQNLDIVATGNIEQLKSRAGVRKALVDAIWA